MTHEEVPQDAAAALAMIEAEQRKVSRAFGASTPWIMAAWGLAWLIGFGALWLIDGMPGVVAIPLVPAIVAFVLCMLGAISATIVVSVRAGRGVRSTPAARFTGIVFGNASFVGFLGVFGLGYVLQANGMPIELLNIYYPVATCVLVGVCYLMAAAVWRVPVLVVLGLLIAATAIVSGFFGYPTHYLVLAVVGGGLMIVGAPVAGRLMGRRS